MCDERDLRGPSRLLGVVVLSVVVALVLVAAPAAAQSDGAFGDVGGTSHEGAIVALAAMGVFEGTGCDAGFCPSEDLRRWEMAVWMVRVLDGEEPPAVSGTRFGDVDASLWWAAHVERFAGLGVTTGFPDGTFRPFAPVSRAHMAAFLTRAFGLPAADDAGFTDIEGSFHSGAINALAASGITTGYSDGTFRPLQHTTRAHIAVFIDRALNLVVFPPPQRFTGVDTGEAHTCALRIDNTIACWGNNDHGQATSPQGSFNAISAGTWHTCALRTDNTIACWGNNGYGQTASPQGSFSAISAGPFHSCGLRTDNTIACWGNNDYRRSTSPQGSFSAISAGRWHTCALRTDNTVTCWGNNDHGQATSPQGSFNAISAGLYHSCGLRTDNTIACWGNNDHGQATSPQGSFSAISAGRWHTCALRTDNTVTCWGNNSYRRATSPRGSFSAISAGLYHSCGLRTDNTVTCWGDNSRGPSGVAAPYGVRLWPDQPDPARCRPRGVEGVTAGFPLSGQASTGTLRAAVLFVDFPDAEASHTTRQEAASSLTGAEEFLERSSYGRLDVEFTPLHRWLRVKHDVDHYLVKGWLDWARTMDEAIQLADPEFDFTGHDVVMIVHPSTHFSVVSASYRAGLVTTDEALVHSATGINLVRRLSSQDGVDPWGRDAAHELAHALGLADLYLYGDAEMPDAPEGKVWVRRRYDLMGLAVQHLADDQDPRFTARWHFANGGTGTSFETAAYEMLAWSRWQLGWLDAWQVRCINLAEATVSLSPVASPGDGTAMAAVPLSDTEMIVIESRRNLGYDTAHEVTRNGATHIRPAPIEGVLVYTVDASVPSGRLPIKVAGHTGDQRIERDPILTVGQSIIVHGYAITVVSDDGQTHTVSITKTQD